MPKYQPVYSHIWKDDCFPELSKDGKLLFLYLITNESINNSGIYPMTIRTIHQETGIPTKIISQLLSNGSMKNVTYDHENGYVFIHKRRLYSPGGNPKQVEKGIQKEFELSKHSFLWDFFDSLYPAILKGMSNRCPTVDQGLPNPSIPLPLPLPLEGLNNNKKPLKIEMRKTAVRILEFLNEIAGRNFKPTDANLENIIARLEEKYTEEDCRKVAVNRCESWLKDPKMAEHVNPQTLYRKSKFPKYLEAPMPTKPETPEDKRLREIHEMSEEKERRRLASANA